MFKRKTSRVRHRKEVRILRANVMSPRIFWFDLLQFCGRAIKLLLVLALLAAAGWGIWRGVEAGLIDNQEFRLSEIRLNPNPALDEIRLLELTGIDLDGSLFECDAGEIEARLEALPELTSATVRREFPGTLVVDVTARNPWLWVASSSRGVPPRDPARGLLVDRSGYAFRCRPGLFKEAEQLPVIEIGDEGDLPEPGEFVRHESYLRGIRLLAVATKAMPEAPQWIDTIRQSKSWASELTTRDEITATFGHEELERQMGDFLAAVEHTRTEERRLKTILLIGKRSIPVTYWDAPPRAVVVEEPVLVRPATRPAGAGTDPASSPGEAPDAGGEVDRDLRELLER